MNCKNVQELLKADYLDGVCSLVDERLIEEHLKRCPLCSNLERELRDQQVALKTAKRQDVPERVWHNIQNAIVAEQLREENRPSQGFFASMKNLFSARRSVFALGSGFAVILLILVMTGISIQKNQNGKIFDVAEYSLTDNGANFLDDFGTPIEKYFL